MSTNAASLSSKGNIFGITNGGFHDLVHIDDSVRVTGTGALTAQVLQFTGAIQIVDQYAVLTSVTTLVNATDVYADAWDGATAVDLTKTPGATMSGFEVGSFFLKDQSAASTYSTMRADQVRFNELSANKIGQPFILNQKNGADSFIRFHLTTTDAPVDFTMSVNFEFRKLSHDGNLFFV